MYELRFDIVVFSMIDFWAWDAARESACWDGTSLSDDQGTGRGIARENFSKKMNIT